MTLKINEQDMLPLPPRDGAALPVAPAAITPDAYRARAGRAAEQFEAQFIGEMLRQMRKTTREMAGEDSIFAGQINNDMMDFADMAVADQLARQRMFGIANAILQQLLPEPGARGAAAPLKEEGAAVALQERTGTQHALALSAFAPVWMPLKPR